jgi:hypothetical protein
MWLERIMVHVTYSVDTLAIESAIPVASARRNLELIFQQHLGGILLCQPLTT